MHEQAHIKGGRMSYLIVGVKTRTLHAVGILPMKAGALGVGSRYGVIDAISTYTP